MTALIAMLGGVRATAFAAFALALLTWGGVQTVRLSSAHKTASQAESKTKTAKVALAAANERIEGFRDLLVQVNKTADEELTKAQAQAAAGKAAVVAAQAEVDKINARLTGAQAQLQDAKRDPTCAEQLKVKLCSAIPLL